MISILYVVSLILVGLAVFLLVIGLRNLLGHFWGEVQDEKTSLMTAFRTVGLRHLGALNRGIIWPSYEANMRRKLITAGEPSGLRPEEIMALQEVGALAAALGGLVVLNALDASFLWCFAFAIAGVCYPIIWVNDQVKKRHFLITRALPYNLDLLTLSVEAGLDFTGALNKVVEKGKGGPLRDEFMLVLKQLKMGKTREEALKNLIARVDLPALTSFVSALIQADKMGTSIGKVLRIQSTQLRIERSQRAEKLANEAPVKMLFPLIACIFPTVFLVLFGPIIFAMTFGDAMG
jgi:tight adherence protein C